MFSDPTRISDEFLAAVGVFDGLHSGHRAIIDPMVAEAHRQGVTPVLFTFAPRPVTIFAPNTPPDELTPAPRKWRLLAELGVERVVVLRFSTRFAQIEAEPFLTEILRAGSGLRGLWIGYDFRFGHERRGDRSMLERFGRRLGFETVPIGPYEVDSLPVSSSRIRAAIRQGSLEEAARLLGRWPDLEGRVVSGRGEGGRVLVPTANLRLPPTQCLPPNGVYVGTAEFDGTEVPAVMNLGRRPTLTEGAEVVPEVHLLDFEGDLRGRSLLFRLRRRLRHEHNFSNINELREQIEADITEARRWFSKENSRDRALADGDESW